ncbi:hypothetical protein BRE01_60280 [Brevibacillus reuszeri]|uniref:Uncharacterized protein n=1 Tax=Brevibacillus reuszeri TaxID=54915 RepID=A0A0K9YPW7_9BACL|nr:hypothetical protein [Brevibacillus reuszeri]KNB70225.1 hypothetical protein ADS79_14755 [Brevibacillus reuszeri]MED1859181.1 hypothetical protein [Brevibacillus reuszeri]GED72326.1 hypothetical protein BRE01_60280 [Brevibacillus reuszeri]
MNRKEVFIEYLSDIADNDTLCRLYDKFDSEFPDKILDLMVEYLVENFNYELNGGHEKQQISLENSFGIKPDKFFKGYAPPQYFKTSE